MLQKLTLSNYVFQAYWGWSSSIQPNCKIPIGIPLAGIAGWRNGFPAGKMDSALEKWIHHWKNGFTIGKMDSPLEKWIPRW